jgi:XisH protein
MNLSEPYIRRPTDLISLSQISPGTAPLTINHNGRSNASTISEFHTALGQFLNYRIAIEVSNEPERILYLAVPIDTYEMFLKFEPAKTVIDRYKVRLIVYSPNQEVIDRWID